MSVGLSLPFSRDKPGKNENVHRMTLRVVVRYRQEWHDLEPTQGLRQQYFPASLCFYCSGNCVNQINAKLVIHPDTAFTPARSIQLSQSRDNGKSVWGHIRHFPLVKEMKRYKNSTPTTRRLCDLQLDTASSSYPVGSDSSSQDPGTTFLLEQK